MAQRRTGRAGLWSQASRACRNAPSSRADRFSPRWRTSTRPAPYWSLGKASSLAFLGSFWCRANQPGRDGARQSRQQPEEEKAGGIAGLAADLEVVVKHFTQFDRIEQCEKQH